MKTYITYIIFGIFSAAILRVLGIEPSYYKPQEVSNGPVNNPAETYKLPQTTPASLLHNYQPSTNYNSNTFEPTEPCRHEINDQTYWNYRNAIYNVSQPIYKKVSALSTHFVISPQTMWLTLAAVAEGCSGEARQQLYRFLSLPEDKCMREAYYHLASQEYKGTDIVFARNRFFIADSSIRVNKYWEEFVKTNAKLNTIYAPYKQNPVGEIESLKHLLHANLSNINLNGNSLLLESLDFHALWTSTFSDAIIEEGPFYDGSGKQIGVIEYMKVVKRANIGFIPSLNAKIIDLPIGREGRYRIYMSIPLPANKNRYEENFGKIENHVVMESVANLQESLEPVEIVIPKVKMTNEIDMKRLLEDIGIKSLWIDPSATRNISDPAALPSAFTQRVSVTFDNGGVRPAVREYQNFVPPLNPSLARLSAPFALGYNTLELSNFVANRPFMYGVFDSLTYTGHIYGSFSKL